MARKLPVGIQDFEDIRRNGYVYVDKTAYVHRLVHEGKPYFLSRPRRFGKSLLVSTLKAYFEGRRDLFSGLAIEALEGDGPGAWQPRPVFHLDFSDADYAREGALEEKIDAMLRSYEETWGSTWGSTLPGSRLHQVLKLAHRQTGHRCVVLVDDCEKPQLDAIDDPALLGRNRATLKSFLGTLKSADGHLRFVLVTGMTSVVNPSFIDSDLNQLNDVSMSERYAAMCGITEDELRESLGPELDVMANALDTDRESYLEVLRRHYGGYRFCAAGPNVFVPHDLIDALSKHRLGTYWPEAGTRAHVVRRAHECGLSPWRLTDGSLHVTEDCLSRCGVDDPDPVPMLYQAGLLAIRPAEGMPYVCELVVPNAELGRELLWRLLPVWAPWCAGRSGCGLPSLSNLVEAGDTEGMRDMVEAILASAAYVQVEDPLEDYCNAVLWLSFTLLGDYLEVEVHQENGRVDCVVEARAHVYVIEFKRGGTADEALDQIRERGYADPFAADPRQLHLVGCAFDPKTRLMSAWEER